MNKNFIWNAIGTSLNSFNSLILLIIVTRCNGIVLSGTFSFVFTISLILYSISNYGGRLYQISDTKEEFSFNEYLTSKLYPSLISILIYIAICIIYKFDMSTIIIGFVLLLLRIIETVSDVIYGSLQKQHKLDIVGKSLTIKSILIMLSFCIVNIITKNILYSSFMLLISAIIVFIIYDLRKIGKIKYQFNFNIYNTSFFIFIFGFITLLTINMPRFITEYTLNESELGYLGILLMIPTVMALVCQFLLQPQLVTLSNYYNNLEISKLKKCYVKINLSIIVFSVVCIIGALLLGDWILSILYGIPFDKYVFGICILILTGTFNGISTVYSSILTIMRKTKIQLVPFTTSLLLSPIVVLILSNFYGLYGVFYSLLLVVIIQTLIFMIITNKYIKKTLL